ncbi:MAG: endonuclease domain-containing protein [Solirubrobacterales bacterium]
MASGPARRSCGARSIGGPSRSLTRTSSGASCRSSGGPDSRSPRRRRWVNGYKVDFYWPELGLVVETDGLRYHRTPAQQSRDRVRDQAHAAAGLTPLRFTRAQVAYDPGHVHATLTAVARRLRTGSRASPARKLE